MKVAGNIKTIISCRKSNPILFYSSFVILGLYALQILLRIEITPLGYFSLYSDPMKEQPTYHQILPFDSAREKPINIYNVPGTGFLMLEILPTRYEILAGSDHCNQMNHKLRRIGLGDNNCCDCDKLKAFEHWFGVYMKRQDLDVKAFKLKLCGFKDGRLKELKDVNDTAIFK